MPSSDHRPSIANPVDKCGHPLKPGQVLDVCLIGMFPAVLAEVRNQTIEVPGMRTPPPSVVVQIVIGMPINPVNGVCDQVYVVAEPRQHGQEVERAAKRAMRNSDGDSGNNGDGDNNRDNDSKRKLGLVLPPD